MIAYKNYVGKVDFDDDAGVIHGDVVNARDVITFQGANLAEAEKAFRESIDDYLAFCRQRGELPDMPVAVE